MKFKALLLTIALLSAGCSTVPSNPSEKAQKLVIPKPKGYTNEQFDKAAKEWENCHIVPTLCLMINDYGVERDLLRAAHGIKVDLTR